MPLPNGNLLVFGEEISPNDIENHPLGPSARVTIARDQIEAIVSDLTAEELSLLRSEIEDVMNPSSEKGLGKALLLYAVLH